MERSGSDVDDEQDLPLELCHLEGLGPRLSGT